MNKMIKIIDNLHLTASHIYYKQGVTGNFKIFDTLARIYRHKNQLLVILDLSILIFIYE
jgi:hypothetical protein